MKYCLALQTALKKNTDGIHLLMTHKTSFQHFLGRCIDVQLDHERMFIDSLCTMNLMQAQGGGFSWVPFPVPFYMKNTLMIRFEDLMGCEILSEDAEDRELQKLNKSFAETLMNYRASLNGLKLQS